MANIKLRDLTSVVEASLFDNLEDSIQELSEDELNLQGGFLMGKLPSLSPFGYPNHY